jgi:hypothetical protein
MTGAQVDKDMFCDWLVDVVGAKNAVVRELKDGSVVVEFEFHPNRPLVGKHHNIRFHISHEAIVQHGLLLNLLALAAHLRDVQRAYEQRKEVSSHEL